MPNPADEKILDVVEEFVCPNQSEAYQTAYRQWRQRKKNRYAFRFSKNPKEAAFSENQSVVNETPAQAEQFALHSLGILIGTAMVLCLVMENVLDKLAILIGGKLGMHLEIMYWGENRYYGDERTLFFFTMALDVLKLLLPALVILFALRMPAKIAVPLPVRNRIQLMYSVAVMMVMSVGVGIAVVSRSAELEKYRLISESSQSDGYWIVLYILLTIFAVPLLWELLFHGCMFQALRQFGDRFAVGAVVVLAVMMTHDVHDALRIGLVTFVISMYMVKTGSFLTAVLLRSIHEIYMFALFEIETYGGIYSLQWWVVVLFPCFVGALVLLITLLRGREKEQQQNNPSYMSLWDQASAFFTTMPMVITLITCALLFVVTLMLGG